MRPQFQSTASRSRIQTYFDGSFDFCADGKVAFYLPVCGLNGTMEDVVAWIPDAPGKWWLRRGVGVILGMEEIERCDYLHEPLRLFWTPQDWLNADKRGAVILDWRCHLPAWLPCNAPIKCQDERLARKVTAALTPRPLYVAVEADHA